MVILKLLLIAHLIGDFFLQPIKLVEQKKNTIKGLIIHTIIYTLMIALVLLLFGSIWEIIFWTFLISISHFAIDCVRIKINKNNKDNKIKFYSFVIDQLIHVLILVINAFVIKSDLNEIGMFFYEIEILREIGFNNIINYSLSILIVLKPASIFIKHFFDFVFIRKEKNEEKSFTDEKEPVITSYNAIIPNENKVEKKIEILQQKVVDNLKEKNNDSDNIGSLIGMLERVIILLLGALGLYSSIALVLTAKSLARFKQLEDKKFAEKYLVGTLMSLIIAILALLVIK